MAENINEEAAIAAANALELQQLQQAHPGLAAAPAPANAALAANAAAAAALQAQLNADVALGQIGENAAMAAALQAQINAAGLGVPLAGAPGGPPDDNNNDGGDGDEWPDNAALNAVNAVNVAPAAPAAPKPVKRRFAVQLTEAEKAILATPRPAEPQPFSAEITERVEDALYTLFKSGFDALHPEKSKADCITILRTTMKTNKAILSGGFLLKTVLGISNADWDLHEIMSSANLSGLDKQKSGSTVQPNSGLDVDFYVPCKSLVPFYASFVPLFQSNIYVGYDASFYCRSFLRKNGIRTVYKCYRELPNEVLEMDIMAVRNRRSPLDVVTNFDLSVCQVWYDGESVKATDPEHILNKVGYLQGEYVKTYLQGNWFLEWRLSKYTKRGFKIVADPKAISTLTPSSILDKTRYFNYCKYSDEEKNNKPDHGRYSEDFMRKWLLRGMLHYKVLGAYTVAETMSDTFRRKSIGYIPGSNNSKIYKMSKLDGYDTDDFLENPQLLRDKVEKPLKEYAEEFLDLFDKNDNTNPFYDIYDHIFGDDATDQLEAGYKLKGYSLKENVKGKLDSLLGPPLPQDGGKRHRRTRKRRSSLRKV